MYILRQIQLTLTCKYRNARGYLIVFVNRDDIITPTTPKGDRLWDIKKKEKGIFPQ